MSIPRGPRILFILSGLGVVLIILVDLLSPPSPEDRLFVLRAELREVRLAADSCRSSLELEEAAVLARSALIDSLRTEIALYESLDPRGVPADSYNVYIRAFEEYNEGIPEQARAADSLRAHRASCLTVIERHNILADSAKSLAEELGLLREVTGETIVPAAPPAAPSDDEGTTGQPQTVP